MFRSVTFGRSPVPDALVRFHFMEDSVPVTWESETVEAVKRAEFAGEVGDIAESFPAGGVRVLIVALGSRESLTNESFFRIISNLGRRLSKSKVVNVHFEGSIRDDDRKLGQTAGEALGLLGWVMDEFKGTATKTPGFVDLCVCSLCEEFDKGLERGIALSRSVNLARTLAFTPPNVATPAWMAGQAERLETTGLLVRVVRGAELETEQLQGLINVGKASEHAPCLIRLEYQPEGMGNKQPVVLLGKTVTFDTGGLAIKSKDGMKGMKIDKAGGCAVLAMMHAVATVIKPDFPVVGLLVAAENSISNNAFRMDDVITFRNGVTVEVTNTDAEGRLVLADGLCWACDREDPRMILDFATLTGGVVIALGSVYAGLFSNDDELAQSLQEAGNASSEKLWRLPLHSEYDDMMKSPVADIVNSVASKGAHPIMGASFLSRFVKAGVKWAHMDIAGTAQTDKDKDAFVPGPTGFGVRLVTEFLESLSY